MSKISEIIDAKKIASTVLVSNSASFLQSSLVRENSILYLASVFSDQELIKSYYEEYENKDLFERSVVCYSIIVALSLKSSSYVDGFFVNLLNEKKLKWAKELAMIYHSKVRMQTLDNMFMNPVVTVTYSNSSIKHEIENTVK